MIIVELMYRDGFRFSCLVKADVTVVAMMALADQARPGVKVSGFRLRRPQ